MFNKSAPQLGLTWTRIKSLFAVADSSLNCNAQLIKNVGAPIDDTDADTKGARNTALDLARSSGMRLTDWALFASSNTRIGTNLTYGQSLLCLLGCTSTGARAYHVASGTETLLFKLYDANAGTLLASKTASVSATGVVTVTWTTPQTLTAGKFYRVAVFNQTNAVHISTSMPAGYPSITNAIPINAFLVHINCVSSAGDVNPTNTPGGTYPVDLDVAT